MQTLKTFDFEVCTSRHYHIVTKDLIGYYQTILLIIQSTLLINKATILFSNCIELTNFVPKNFFVLYLQKTALSQSESSNFVIYVMSQFTLF